MSQVSSEKSFLATAVERLGDLTRAPIGLDRLAAVNRRVVTAYLEANLKLIEGLKEAIELALDSVEDAEPRRPDAPPGS